MVSARLAEVKALNKYEVVEKPPEANFLHLGQVVSGEIAIATSKIGNDQSLKIRLEDSGAKNFDSFKSSFKRSCLKVGFKGRCIEKDGYIYCFKV